MEKRKRALGVTTQSNGEVLSTLHMILAGNPGTGKTMVARCMTGILHDIGLLESDEVVEVQRSDLVSSFIGDTAKKTEEKIKAAYGKVLFVDEAYTLTSKSEKDFGKEAVETIMRYMLPAATNKQQPVFIFAGYMANMAEFTNINQGLRRRIKHNFEFADYSPLDLAKITCNKLIKDKMTFPYGIEEDLSNCFDKIPKNIRSEFNASLCGDLINEVRLQQEKRLTFDATFQEVVKYTKDDFKFGIEALVSSMDLEAMLNKATQTHEVWLHIDGVGIITSTR